VRQKRRAALVGLGIRLLDQCGRQSHPRISIRSRGEIDRLPQADRKLARLRGILRLRRDKHGSGGKPRESGD